MNAQELRYVRSTYASLATEHKNREDRVGKLEREIEDAASRTTLALYDAAEQVAMLRAFLKSVADSDAFDEFVKQKEAESEQARATGHTDTGDIGG